MARKNPEKTLIQELFYIFKVVLKPDPKPVNGKLYRLKISRSLWKDCRARNAIAGHSGRLPEGTILMAIETAEQYPEFAMTRFWAIKVIAGEHIGWITLQQMMFWECLERVR